MQSPNGTAGAVARCPVGAADRGLAAPQLYGSLDFRPEWARLRERDTLEWTTVGDTGFWSAVRYCDVDQVLRDSQTFTSERGTLLAVLGVEDPAGGKQIAATDPPRHTVMRNRLQKALGIRAIEQQQDMITRLVREVLAPLADGGVFDFGAAMLSLPVAIAGEAMGLPRADWPRLGRLLTTSIAPEDPDYLTPRGVKPTLDRAHRELFAYLQDVCAQRRDNLGDDLISVLITTEVDGRVMTPGEVISNCYSLLLGATVTTAHPPTYALTEHIADGVLDRWADDLSVTPSAVEEVLRLGSPASHFMRYATTDTQVRGTTIRAGEAVVCWLGSANRDGAVFADPDTFDPRRRPNRHLAFGTGPHFCVGHVVARVTLRILFDELLGGFRDFRPAGPPVRLVSNVISGYKHVPITATPVAGRAGSRSS
ncbi:cytochrome P450 [Plantactinospora sp. KBS50]|uniref:cytochrome P450 n=1 Tax=Plantactinospora sp. KBS50 TaxID=2024580 RepID=UPI000BAA9A63|nr:cytochrome P450 [Plantactinospora sp. KBS50]ASW54302.1 cytochrome P450 [Plantactinospora sp. KBS50]